MCGPRPAKAFSVVGASVTGAVLENVGLPVYRQDDRTLVGMRLVEGADPSPDVFASATNAIMIVERAFEHISLLNLGMLMHGQRCTRRPFEEAVISPFSLSS
jgi:hypothetical protein